MIHHQDVGVGVPSDRVAVHGHEVVGAVHPLGQLDGYVPDAIEVLLPRHVELVGVEGEHVAVEHVLAPVRPRDELGPLDELGGRRAAVSH